MNIKIELRDTATLSRIEELGKHLNDLEHNPNDMDQMIRVTGFADVIAGIGLEGRS